MPARDRFRQQILVDLRVGGEGRPPLSYEGYLDLAEDERRGDEAAFVDMLFMPRVLRCLGYDEADWTYNRAKTRGKPDFVVHPLGAVAFVIEDANTTKPFGAEDIEQLRRYTAGTQGYALWTNGNTILGLRFAGAGTYDILVRVEVDERQLEVEDTEASFDLLELLYGRERFTAMRGVLDRISIPEAQWEREARAILEPVAQRQFIAESRDLLDKLATVARAAIDRAEQEVQEARRDLSDTVGVLGQQSDRLIENLQLPQAGRHEFENRLKHFLASPLAVDETHLHELRPAGLRGGPEGEWNQAVKRILSSVAEFRERQQSRAVSQRVHDSFQLWKARYRVIEGPTITEVERRAAYAEQVAYAFFVRVLLARVLEDKGIIRRLISDGGLQRWREIVDPARGTNLEPRIHGAALLEVVYAAVSVYYQHFFDQPVFDWFMPDDYVLALTLERLGTFQFRDIDRDLLGYAYEAYVERAFRGQKGHFLTRGEVVDYILDEVGYQGAATIGRRVMDPAVGSGSFLVHAARRLRDALQQAAARTGTDRAEIARAFVRVLQQDFVGFEINPFSCYLAELNLLLQVLDDLVYLWNAGHPIAVDRFQIYNTNSLVLPNDVLQQRAELTDDPQIQLDAAAEIKLNQQGAFDFVVGNPPYLNRGILTELPDLRAFPFYNSVFGGGDTNHFQAFVRLATHYAAPGGSIGMILPLNLYGDKSSGSLRDWLGAASLNAAPPDGLPAGVAVSSATRFYSRRVLFEDVLQGVCVTTWRRLEQGLAPPQDVTVAGGVDVEQARANRLRIPAARVLMPDPLRHGKRVHDLWYGAWLVVPDERYVRAWEAIRGSSSVDLRTWAAGDIKFQQGDVNATRTRPLRSHEHGGQVAEIRRPVPTAGSRDFEVFGRVFPSGELDAEADVDAMRLTPRQRQDAERERLERVLRIAELRDDETVLALKDIVGIEPARPVVGSLFRRGPTSPLCFEHTVQVAFPSRRGSDDKVAAAFALLVSSVSNFVLSLFSTNVHVTTNEIERLPVPSLDDVTLRNLAQLGWELQQAGTQLSERRERLGTSDSVPSPTRVLELGGVPRESLEAAVFRGDVTLPVDSSRHLSTLWTTGAVGFGNPADGYARVVELLVAGVNAAYRDVGSRLLLPRPAGAASFLESYRDEERALLGQQEAVYHALGAIDRAVLGIYDIRDPETRFLIGSGMPWASTGTELAQGALRHL